LSNTQIYHAIVGCGRVSSNHADAFARIPGVTLYYANDILRERTEELASRFGIQHVTTNYQDVLNDPKVTSISLAVPHYLHASMALQAIASGKHVLVEKPFVIKPEDGTEVMTSMQSKGVVVMPVSQHHFDPILCCIKQLILDNELGNIVMTRSHLECVRSKEYYTDSPWRGLWSGEGGSVLINQAYHIVDLLLWLVGSVKRVKAEMANLANAKIMETEDTFTASIVFECKALGNLTITGAGGGEWESYIEIIGTEGVIAFDIAYPNTIHRFELNNKTSMQAWKNKFEESRESGFVSPPGIDYYGNSHCHQARAFVEQIWSQLPQDGVDIKHALKVVNLIQHLYDSARSGNTVLVETSSGA
jgi:predicted dehydrogenase